MTCFYYITRKQIGMRELGAADGSGTTVTPGCLVYESGAPEFDGIHEITSVVPASGIPRAALPALLDCGAISLIGRMADGVGESASEASHVTCEGRFVAAGYEFAVFAPAFGMPSLIEGPNHRAPAGSMS